MSQFVQIWIYTPYIAVYLYSNMRGGVMSFKDTETLSTGIEFIVEAVAVKTNGQDHSALGLYLISLLLEDQKISLDCDDKRKRVVVPLGKLRQTHLEMGWKCPSF
jgi:hypothetical protein